jgi:hypothetical protein|nr:MAG TPA: hypothetical protein [Caudoviricetes sp.]DAX54719.1 MAG TPA: hypothetical protein [Caudoviricetes sp.]
MLEKAVEEVKIIQNDAESTIVIDDAEFQKVVKDEGIPNGVISTDDLTDDEIMELLEDPVDNPEAIKAINNMVNNIEEDKIEEEKEVSE